MADLIGDNAEPSVTYVWIEMFGPLWSNNKERK